MEATVKEIILGSLLGDGSLKISRGYANARFAFRHSAVQKEYFFWKVKYLKSISSKKCFWQQDDGKIRYQSLATEDLSMLYHLTHRKGLLHINREWLGLLTPLSLAVWWCDDGSLAGDTRQGVICTDSFSVDCVLSLSTYLRDSWKVRTRVSKCMKKYFRLYIDSSEELKKFLRLILPHIPVENMLPKVILLYKDLNLQQRWIFEVSSLSQFPENTIMKYWKEKVLKRNDFRKRYSPTL